MSKATFTKRFLRQFDLGKDLIGKPIVKKLDYVKPAEKRTPFKLKCASKEFIILVAPGQAINLKKTCKKLEK